MTSSRHHHQSSYTKGVSESARKKTTNVGVGTSQTSYHVTTERSHKKTATGVSEKTPKPRIFDSGYSSGGVAGGRSSGSQLGRTTDKTLLTGSPSLSIPSATVSIPATLSDLRVSGEGVRRVERGRVRQLEHEVSVLEQQLAEKTQSAQTRVAEVTCMRSELAREKAALARVSYHHFLSN